MTEAEEALIRKRDNNAAAFMTGEPWPAPDYECVATLRADRHTLLREVDRLRAASKETREILARARLNCEHEWAETLCGPDTVGEHCLHCDVDRDYDDSDGYEWMR